MRVLKNNAICVIVDVQEKLFHHMHEKELLEKNTKILVKGLKALKIPCLVTEQYRKGLGATIESIEELVANDTHYEKLAFSCCDNPEITEAIETGSKRSVIIAGVESHVCVLQTAIDLKERGYHPIVVEDCVGSRTIENKRIAMERLRHEGVVVTTYESILFELCRTAECNVFKTISQLVK